MGQRSRKRRREGAGTAGRATVPAKRPGARGGAAAQPSRATRSELRNAEARAELEPLREGERPTAVTVAAVVAVLLAAGNLALWLAGLKIKGKDPGAGGVIIFAALMLAAAGGMWQAKYWAVLGFQALLAVTVIIAALSLVVASNVQAVILCLTIMGLGGWLFWKLVRSMARIQMPQRPPPRV